jgi:2',3'-cyclic-nucleotide 2'-phosphodiesterase (5'-nucleotidase family)
MPGKITVEDVYNIIPTGGRVYTYSMSGKQIKRLLENVMDSVVGNDPYTRVGGDMIRFSGLKLVYDLGNAQYERIVSMTTTDGQAILADKEYSIAAVNTRFQNNPLFGASNIVDTGKVFADELIEYIRTNSPIIAALDDRIISRRDGD